MSLTNPSKIISFRLPTNTITEIKSEAENKNVSLNSIISNILDKYVQWDTHLKEMELFPLPKFVLQQLIDHISTNTLEKFVESFYEFIKESTLLTKNEYSFEQCMIFLQSYIDEFGFHSKHVIENSIHHYTIRHKLGIKWSVFLESLAKRIFSDFIEEKNYKFLLTPSTIKISIKLKDDFHEIKKNNF